MEHLMLGSASVRLVVELIIYARRFGEQFYNRVHVGLYDSGEMIGV